VWTTSGGIGASEMAVLDEFLVVVLAAAVGAPFTSSNRTVQPAGPSGPGGIDHEIDVQSSMEELDWVREQGVVMQSARGPVPSLAERVAGGPIRGSWWGHPSGHEIYRVLNEVRASPDVVAVRLINGKVTLIHRRLWPALVRVADRFASDRLAAIEEVHTGSGAHQTIAVPFPDWVPAEDSTAADLLTVDEALAQLPACLR